MSSLRTFSEELSTEECAAHWPVVTSKNFLYQPVGAEENKPILKETS